MKDGFIGVISLNGVRLLHHLICHSGFPFSTEFLDFLFVVELGIILVAAVSLCLASLQNLRQSTTYMFCYAGPTLPHG